LGDWSFGRLVVWEIGCLVVWSFGRLGEEVFISNAVNQNKMAPPPTRNDTIVIPSKPFVIASLPKGDISPQMAQAINILMCAYSGFLLSIFAIIDFSSAKV
jgi:hypothetical protein